MRLHRLDVEGFGPFRRRQTVDFDALARDGIFLIGGKTGAGKSSILDAVCFALYGAVPRYDEGEKRIRSDHSALDEPTRVRLEFSVAGSRWAVERVPTYERLKRNGRGTTQTPAEARLEEWVDGGWEGRAVRPVDVAHELAPLLGLTQQQFLQVILLAQGRFSRFLLARNDERQALLRTLFDSERFGSYEAALERRRKETVDRLTWENRTLLAQLETAERLIETEDDLLGDGAGGGLDTEHPETDAEAGEPGAQPAVGDLGELTVAARIDRVRRARLRAAHLREIAGAAEAEARRAHDAAERAHVAAVETRREQTRRDEARDALAALEDRADDTDRARATLRAALDAETLRAPLAALDRANDALSQAREAQLLTQSAWEATGETARSRAAVQTRADEVLAEIGALTVAAEAEKRLDALLEERDTLREVARAAEKELLALSDRTADLPARIDALTAAAASAGARAEAREAAAAAREAARAARAAAEEAVQRSQEVEASLAAAHAAGRDLTRASAELDALRERRFRDHAAELAESLVDGEPCPVCGACEHPHPTPRTDGPVTDVDIAAAEAAKAAAITADTAATDALQAAREALAGATLRAGGLTPVQASEAEEAAQRALDAADEAVAERERLHAERAALIASAAELDASLAALGAGARDAANELAAVERSIVETTATVVGARGNHPTVSARIAQSDVVARRARALLSDLDAVASRTEAVEGADAQWRAAVAASPFADRAAVEAALCDTTTRERLAADVSAFDARRASLKETLIALELRMLPDEPVDVDLVSTALAAAVDQRDAAVRRATSAARLADQLDDAARATDIAYETIGDLTAEAQTAERLANAVAGRAPNTLKMSLETFVLAAELEEIVGAANLRLDEMTQGRYRLRHTDARAARGAASGLGIDVLDAFTGQARPVQSLSGGETFLASLSLALGLAEVVTARAGGITLDTLFIDEGFGSLDAETLDVAMRTLDELRQGGRVIGVISHVEAMKDQLPAQITVRTAPGGDSVIVQQSLLVAEDV